jgi:putative hydrolase of the HAD superfamily
MDPHLVDESLWRILVGIEPKKVDLLKKLSQKYDLYMLSNNNPVCLPRAEVMFAEAGFPMYEGFKKCYISSEMKALKPSEKFYKAVVEDIALPAEEMLFIDDSQRNVDGAIAAGLPAVYYQPGTDLASVLAEALCDSSIL